MNYFEMELFHKAPLSAIINRKAFEAVGGFTGKPFLGDFEMWHILSQHYPVVLMPHGIVWYRKHQDQETHKMKTDPRKPFEYFIVGKNMINNKNCPLNKNDKNKVIRYYKRKEAEKILSAAKHHSIQKALELKKASGLSLIETLKYKFS